MSKKEETKINGALPSEAPRIDYRIDGNDIVRSDKDGEQVVATIKSGVVRLVPEYVTYRRQIVGYLNGEGMEVKSVIMDGDDVDDVSNIPPAPKKNPRLGDKTPAYVEWVKKYKPSEFKARYGIVGQGTVKKQRTFIDPETGEKKAEHYDVEATIAYRKTHLTELREGAEMNDSDSDWSLDVTPTKED